MDAALERAVAAQRAAAQPDIFAFVTANAGSGKTKVLVDRVARLLLEGAAPESILCVTYTKAAAAEMQTRLFDRLSTWAAADDIQLRGFLAGLDGGVREHGAEALGKARLLFARALEAPGGLRIETVHAFCQRVLSRFPLEAGLAPGFEVMEEAAQSALIAAIRVDLAQERLAGGHELADAYGVCADNAAERAGDEAIEALLSAALSRPGGAKFDPAAIMDLFGANVEDDEETILHSLVTEAPLLLLRQACADLHPFLTNKTDKTTYDNIECFLNCGESGQILLDHYLAIFLTGSGPLHQRTLRKRTVSMTARADSPALRALFGDTAEDEGWPMQALRKGLMHARATTLAQGSRALAAMSVILRGRYEAAKRAKGLLDFDDLITAMRRLLIERQAGPWVAYKLDGGLEHILIDEAQDIAPTQWTIMSRLWAPFFDSERQRTVFAVGDEKQSIYSFQGAEPERFLHESRQLSKACAQYDRPYAAPSLLLSFRSAPEILTLVDATLRAAAPLMAEDTIGPAADIARHEARRADQPGRVELWPPAPQPERRELADPAAPIDRIPPNSSQAQLAEAVAEEIARALREGDGVWDEKREQGRSLPFRRPVKPADFLILTRNRGPLFQLLIKALKKRNIPAAGADRFVLADSLAVQDLLALGRFAVDPADDLALAECLRGPLFDLTDDDLALFPLAFGRAPTESLWARLCASDDPALQRAAAILRARLAAADGPPFAFFLDALEARYDRNMTGYQRFEARLGLEARDPIQALLARAQSATREETPSLLAFVNCFAHDETQIRRELSAPRDEVRVMTAHGAKGLEAPVVFLPDCAAPAAPGGNRPERGLVFVDDLPIWASSASPYDPSFITAARERRDRREAAEFKRLLYVAMTRARDRLVVAAAARGRAPGMVAADSWMSLVEAGFDLLADEGAAVTPIATPFGPGRAVGPAVAAGNQPDPARARMAGSAAPDWLTSPLPPAAAASRLAAPSRLGGDENAGRALSPLRAREPGRFARGRFIHLLLQILPGIAPEARRAAGLRLLAREPMLSTAQGEAAIAEALAVIATPALATLFGPDSRAEAAIIGRSPLLPPGLVINGRVDRLAITPVEVIVADFKTNRPPPRVAEDAPSAYVKQMAAYWATLSAQFPGHEVLAALIWTDGPIVMPLPSHLLEAALRRL